MPQSYSSTQTLVFAQLPTLKEIRIGSAALRDLAGQALSILAQPNGKAKFLEELNTTDWCRMVTRVFEAASQIADWLNTGESVIVQAGDAWDYASIITALAQVIIDPFYRTAEGLCVLVDKEFCQGGYQFDIRAGRSKRGSTSGSQGSLLGTSKGANELSPTLLLLLWCIWSMSSQAPSSFEYGEALLLFLVDSIYSARFKEFCLNSHRERAQAELAQSPSVWNFVRYHAAVFISPVDVFKSKLQVAPLVLGSAVWSRLLFRAHPSFLNENVRLSENLPPSRALRVYLPMFDCHFSNLCTAAAQRDVNEIFLVKNLLTVVPVELSRLTKVDRLILDENLICAIPGELLESRLAQSLQFLSLRDNLITWLPPSLSNLVNIVSLDFSANLLETLPRPIGGLVSLKHLVLSRNRLNRLPPSFRNLTSLETLDLSFNLFSSLPSAALAGLSNLELLNVSSNQIVVLPTAISKLANLRTLNLNGNLLEHLPNEFHALEKLEFLKISRNRFHTLPEALCKCPQLSKLEASENVIEEIPTSIALLHGLRILDLFGNRLSRLPPAVGQLRSLHTLGLRGNRLKELPLTMCLLKELETLELSGNPNLTLPSGVPAIMKTLRIELDSTVTISSIRFGASFLRIADTDLS